MDPLSIITAITGLVGAGSSLFGGGGSSRGSETQTVTPAPWSSVGTGSEDIWNSAVNKVLGNGMQLRPDLTPEEQGEVDRIIKEYTDKSKGSTWYMDPVAVAQLNSDLAPYTTTGGGLEEWIKEDTGFKEQAAQDYLDRMTGVDTGFKNALTGYQKDINTPAFYLNLGGKNVGVNTGGTRDAIGQLTNLAAAMYGVDSDAAQRALTKAETYTPNAANLAILDKLWPMAMQMQNLRFGLPSTTETGSYTPSLVDRLGDAIPFIEQLGSLFGKKSEGSTNPVLVQT